MQKIIKNDSVTSDFFGNDSTIMQGIEGIWKQQVVERLVKIEKVTIKPKKDVFFLVAMALYMIVLVGVVISWPIKVAIITGVCFLLFVQSLYRHTPFFWGMVVIGFHILLWAASANPPSDFSPELIEQRLLLASYMLPSLLFSFAVPMFVAVAAYGLSEIFAGIANKHADAVHEREQENAFNAEMDQLRQRYNTDSLFRLQEIKTYISTCLVPETQKKVDDLSAKINTAVNNEKRRLESQLQSVTDALDQFQKGESESPEFARLHAAKKAIESKINLVNDDIAAAYAQERLDSNDYITFLNDQANQMERVLNKTRQIEHLLPVLDEHVPDEYNSVNAANLLSEPDRVWQEFMEQFTAINGGLKSAVAESQQVLDEHKLLAAGATPVYVLTAEQNPVA